ncbi:coiled-coil domain-containing protein 130 [Entomortierella parvispora]|uniref:Coiled-coil domain-containing protein 130 n=1 Tax=Entomortierella parvispora TaxID=205924 RepID=A0A9P3M024_9FUNG|nr:coiled-coil domain-containing protein 130 [Entomortierella parvispora]
MADRKATNKYYPPDWDPSKGSINTYMGQHPLRDRARKLDQGILIVRFELPYNIWCNGCGNPIGMGVRYNAEKKKVGNYFSTAILSFRMKCHLCDNWFEIQTDPKNAAYVITSGARKKVEDYDAEDAETYELGTEEERERRELDKFAKLEHAQLDVQKAKSGQTRLTRLQNLNKQQWGDPYILSQHLRKKFRDEKKERLKEEAECKSVADRIGFGFNVLPESEQDRERSRMIQFDSGQKQQMELRLRQVKTGGLFSTKSSVGSLRTLTTRSKQLASGTNSSGESVAKRLASTISANTKLQTDPFLTGQAVIGKHRPNGSGVTLRAMSTPSDTNTKPTPVSLVSYGQDESDDDNDDNT